MFQFLRKLFKSKPQIEPCRKKQYLQNKCCALAASFPLMHDVDNVNAGFEITKTVFTSDYNYEEMDLKLTQYIYNNLSKEPIAIDYYMKKIT